MKFKTIFIENISLCFSSQISFTLLLCRYLIHCLGGTVEFCMTDLSSVLSFPHRDRKKDQETKNGSGLSGPRCSGCGWPRWGLAQHDSIQEGTAAFCLSILYALDLPSLKSSQQVNTWKQKEFSQQIYIQWGQGRLTESWILLSTGFEFELVYLSVCRCIVITWYLFSFFVYGIFHSLPDPHGHF